jgi:hypothetical protein
LRVAQPALSRQIQALEAEVGFKLFERLSREVKLSTAGRLFLEEARRILQPVDDALKRTLSSQLARLAAGFADRPVRLGELTDVLQLRGYNALLLFLAFPFVTPVPLPGFSTPFGLEIALLGVRMVRGALPGRRGSVAVHFHLRHMHSVTPSSPISGCDDGGI